MTIYEDLISGGNFSFPSDGAGEVKVRIVEGIATTRAAASRDSGDRYVDISLSPEAVNSYRDFDDFCSGLEAQLSDRYSRLFDNSRTLLTLDELEADLQRFQSFGDSLFGGHEACEFTTPGKGWKGGA